MTQCKLRCTTVVARTLAMAGRGKPYHSPPFSNVGRIKSFVWGTLSKPKFCWSGKAKNKERVGQVLHDDVRQEGSEKASHYTFHWTFKNHIILDVWT